MAFFAAPGAAERAGFRACRRCRPGAGPGDPRAAWVARACRLLESNAEEPVTLAALSREVGVSPHHLQRVFKKVTGVSPRE